MSVLGRPMNVSSTSSLNVFVVIRSREFIEALDDSEASLGYGGSFMNPVEDFFLLTNPFRFTSVQYF